MLDISQSIPFLKAKLQTSLRELGLNETQTEELISQFDFHARRIDLLAFITSVERYGISREKLTSFLKSVGIDQAILMQANARADLRKAGLDESKLQEVYFSD